MRSAHPGVKRADFRPWTCAFRLSHGMTLIEVIVSTALFGALMVLVGSFLTAGEKTYSAGAVQEDMESRGRKLIDFIQDELVKARVTNVTNSHTTMTFMIPVDHDGDNDVIDAGNTIEYGYINPATNQPMLNWSAAFQFVTARTVSEATLTVHINLDGDKADSFVQGTVDKVIYDDLGVEVLRVSIDDYVILRSVTLDADVDGAVAGVQDPLFYRTDTTGAEQPLTGNIVDVNVWHGKSGDPGNFYIRNNSQRIMLRNAQ